MAGRFQELDIHSHSASGGTDRSVGPSHVGSEAHPGLGSPAVSALAFPAGRGHPKTVLGRAPSCWLLGRGVQGCAPALPFEGVEEACFAGLLLQAGSLWEKLSGHTTTVLSFLLRAQGSPIPTEA